MNKIKKIIELLCFVVVEDGIEKIAMDSYIPLIYLNQEGMIDDNIMEIMQQLATKHRTTFMLRRYVLSDTIEVIEPMIASLTM
jgi:hypothetical protein